MCYTKNQLHFYPSLTHITQKSRPLAQSTSAIALVAIIAVVVLFLYLLSSSSLLQRSSRTAVFPGLDNGDSAISGTVTDIVGPGELVLKTSQGKAEIVVPVNAVVSRDQKAMPFSSIKVNDAVAIAGKITSIKFAGTKLRDDSYVAPTEIPQQYPSRPASIANVSPNPAQIGGTITMFCSQCDQATGLRMGGRTIPVAISNGGKIVRATVPLDQPAGEVSLAVVTTRDGDSNSLSLMVTRPAPLTQSNFSAAAIGSNTIRLRGTTSRAATASGSCQALATNGKLVTGRATTAAGTAHEVVVSGVLSQRNYACTMTYTSSDGSQITSPTQQIIAK